MSWAAHADPELAAEMRAAAVVCARQARPARVERRLHGPLQLWAAVTGGFWICTGCQGRVVAGAEARPGECERCAEGLRDPRVVVGWRFFPPGVVQ